MAGKSKGFSKTIEKDLGEKRIRKLLEAMKAPPDGPHVKVGILKDAGMHDETQGVSVAQVALWNEFGTDRTPERPFMRTSAEELMPIMKKFSEFILNAVVTEKISLSGGLDRMGILAKQHIQKKIRDWKIPGNAPSTILRKARKAGRKMIAAGFGRSVEDGLAAMAQYDNPLVDTAQMLNSVNYKKVLK